MILKPLRRTGTEKNILFIFLGESINPFSGYTVAWDLVDDVWEIQTPASFSHIHIFISHVNIDTGLSGSVDH